MHHTHSLQEQRRKTTAVDQSVQVNAPPIRVGSSQTTNTQTNAACTQTPNATTKPMSTQTTISNKSANKPMSTQTTIVKTSTNKRTTTKRIKTKAVDKGGDGPVSKSFVQRLKDRLTKTHGRLKEATEERDAHRRQNYELNQIKNRLLVRISVQFRVRVSGKLHACVAGGSIRG